MLYKKYRLVSRELLPFKMAKDGADLEFWCERHRIKRLKFTRMTLSESIDIEKNYLKTDYMFYQYESILVQHESFESFLYGFSYVSDPINLFDKSDSWIKRFFKWILDLTLFTFF